MKRYFLILIIISICCCNIQTKNKNLPKGKTLEISLNIPEQIKMEAQSEFVSITDSKLCKCRSALDGELHPIVETIKIEFDHKGKYSIPLFLKKKLHCEWKLQLSKLIFYEKGKSLPINTIWIYPEITENDEALFRKLDRKITIECRKYFNPKTSPNRYFTKGINKNIEQNDHRKFYHLEGIKGKKISLELDVIIIEGNPIPIDL